VPYSLRFLYFRPFILGGLCVRSGLSSISNSSSSPKKGRIISNHCCSLYLPVYNIPVVSPILVIYSFGRVSFCFWDRLKHADTLLSPCFLLRTKPFLHYVPLYTCFHRYSLDGQCCCTRLVKLPFIRVLAYSSLSMDCKFVCAPL
jgi:hypothetical protein